MRVRKTPQSQRTTYKQYDEDGKLLYEFTPDENGAETRIEVIEENKKLIDRMHRWDDHEVNENLKEIHLTKEEKDKQKRNFRQFMPFDAPVKNEDGDECSMSETVKFNEEVRRNNPDPYEDSGIHDAIIDTCGFTDQEKKVYGMMLQQLDDRDKVLQKEIAAKLGVSEKRISTVVANIWRKIGSSEEVKKYFRDFD